MSIYIALILIILATSAIAKILISEKERQEKTIAFISMLLIFLILALKKETVGIDIFGYKRDYEYSCFVAWGSWTVGHFEAGYVTLMMLFSKLGISFQIFAAFLYFVWCSAIYMLIRRYSENATLSVLFFLCYQFFVFSTSSLRQTLAMGMCIYAFFLCTAKKRIVKLCALLVIALAMTMHTSAIVFFIVPVVLWLFQGRVHISLWLGLLAVVVVFRKTIWDIVELFFGHAMTQLEFGGSFVFLAGLAVFLSFSYFYQYNPYSKRLVPHAVLEEHISRFDPFVVRVIFLCLLCYFTFVGDAMLRASMYFTMLLIPGIPTYIAKYEPKTRMALNWAMGIFLIILFYRDTLLPNQLNLCPYQFFWQ